MNGILMRDKLQGKKVDVKIDSFLREKLSRRDESGIYNFMHPNFLDELSEKVSSQPTFVNSIIKAGFSCVVDYLENRLLGIDLSDSSKTEEALVDCGNVFGHKAQNWSREALDYYTRGADILSDEGEKTLAFTVKVAYLSAKIHVVSRIGRRQPELDYVLSRFKTTVNNIGEALGLEKKCDWQEQLQKELLYEYGIDIAGVEMNPETYHKFELGEYRKLIASYRELFGETEPDNALEKLWEQEGSDLNS